MGESKRRKDIDPSYGRPKRGLVVSPPIEVEGTRLSARSSNLDPQELRVATLLWDRAVWPKSRAIHFASGPDEQFLEDEGFLTRPEYTVWGDAAQGFVQQQIQAFNDLDAREPGLWSLAQGENSLLVRGGQLIEGGNAQLHLNRAIPVPKEDVPLAEVLEFKARRDAELQAIRSEIDVFVSSIEKAEKPQEELLAHVAAIDKACADAIRVGNEWQFPIRLTDFKIDYKFRPLGTLGGALTGALGGQAVNLTGTQAVLSGIAGAALATAPILELSWKKFEWRGLRPRQGPYRYAYEIHREFY